MEVGVHGRLKQIIIVKSDPDHAQTPAHVRMVLSVRGWVRRPSAVSLVGCLCMDQLMVTGVFGLLGLLVLSLVVLEYRQGMIIIIFQTSII